MNKITLVLSQTKYIKDILVKFDLKNCNGADVPLVTSEKLSKYMREVVVDSTLCRKQLEAYNMLCEQDQR